MSSVALAPARSLARSLASSVVVVKIVSLLFWCGSQHCYYFIATAIVLVAFVTVAIIVVAVAVCAFVIVADADAVAFVVVLAISYSGIGGKHISTFHMSFI